MKDQNVKTIVAGWLKEHGFDGLVSDSGCGCARDDLAPCCCDDIDQCRPAYLVPCPREECTCTSVPCVCRWYSVRKTRQCKAALAKGAG